MATGTGNVARIGIITGLTVFVAAYVQYAAEDVGVGPGRAMHSAPAAHAASVTSDAERQVRSNVREVDRVFGPGRLDVFLKGGPVDMAHPALANVVLSGRTCDLHGRRFVYFSPSDGGRMVAIGLNDIVMARLLEPPKIEQPQKPGGGVTWTIGDTADEHDGMSAKDVQAAEERRIGAAEETDALFGENMEIYVAGTELRLDKPSLSGARVYSSVEAGGVRFLIVVLNDKSVCLVNCNSVVGVRHGGK